MMTKNRKKYTRFPKPVIGLIGGIGSGKSFVAKQFAKNGCAVVDSDELGHEVLKDPSVIAQLTRWWGREVLDLHGRVMRKWVAKKVFNSPSELARLQRLVHPKIALLRKKIMSKLAMDKKIKGVVLDSPLLLESGLFKECDAIIFINTLKKTRLLRLKKSRGWNAAEMARRENFQMSLDKKRQFADYIIDNDGDLVHCIGQIRDVLSRILVDYGLSKRG